MKQVYLLSVLTILLLLHSFQSLAVSAYPYPFTYTQPDGAQVTITLKGDEKVHWAETTDGYKLLNNGKNGWEYAVLNKNGDLQCSGKLAREIIKRSSAEKKLLSQTSKNIHFSEKQSVFLKSFWETRHITESKSNSSSSIQRSSGITDSATVIQNSSGVSKVFSPLGGKKLVMILIGFTDKAFSKTQADFSNLMNQVGYNLNGAAGSVKDYFMEISYNQFNVTTTVAGPYTAAHNMAYYGTNDSNGYDQNPEALITEAVTKADNDVNFADFDNDGDGTVDGVYVVYAGYGEASGAPAYTIWPHASSITTMVCDGVKISKYSCSNELQGTSGSTMTTIGVICHEFGHVCGAMDYYDTNYSTNGQYSGTGAWDLMASGNWNGSPAGCKPAHMNPYDKIRAHWVSPTLLTSDASVTLNDIKDNPVIYRYNTPTNNEYFLLENRQQTGFNAGVPGHGLMIYHVDGNYITNHYSANDINATSHQGLLPMAANATVDNGVLNGIINTTACPWPGTSAKTTFDDTTTPNSKSWATANTNGGLYNITESSGVISLCYKSCPAINPVFNFTAIPANSTQINLSWTNNAANNDVIIAYNTSDTFGALTNGTTYNVADALSGGGTIIFKGPASSFNQTGLSASTNYYYQIWAVDGSLNYSAETATNTQTSCSSVSSLPFNEGFEGGVLPDCWTKENVSGVTNWTYQQGGYYSGYGPASSHNGLKNATLFVASYTSSVTKLISPPLDLTGTTTPVLKFWHTQLQWGGQDILRVYYRTTATDAWTQLAVYTSSISSWTMETIALPYPSSTYYIAFEGTTNYGLGVCIDDVEIESSDCVAGTWLGTQSSDWFDPANWCGSIPTSTTNVIIPAGTPYSPSIDADGSVCQNITIDNEADLSMNSSILYTLNVTGNWNNNGVFNAGAGKVKFSGTNNLQTIGGSSTTTFNRLSVSKGTLSNVVEATSSISLSATTNPLELISGTFKLSTNSVLSPFTGNPTIGSDCGIWNNGGTINSEGLSWKLNGLLRSSAGIINIGNTVDNALNYVTGSAITIDGGIINIASRICPNTVGTDITTYNQSGGTINVNTAGSTSTAVAPFDITSGSYFMMTGGTVSIQNASGFTSEYQNLATNYTVTGGTLQIGNASTSGKPVIRINSTTPVYNLTLNGSGMPTVKLLSDLTVLNNVMFGSGSTPDINNFNLYAGGSWINNSEKKLSGTVIFNGNTAQYILGTATTVFNNLTMNNSSGIELNSNITVNGTLKLNSGVISTSDNRVTIPTSGNISRTSGHIFGNLQKSISVGSNVSTTFEIGDAVPANYTPATLTMASVTTSGDLTAKTIASDHPDIVNSFLYSDKSVNRYWNLINTDIEFSNSSAEFTYLASDLDAATNTSNLLAGQYTSSSWIYPTVETKGSGTIKITGLNSLGSFQLAEGCDAIIAPTFDAVTPICVGDALAALPTTSKNGITGTWSPAIVNTQTTEYIFTPDAGQCATAKILTITVNPIVTPTFDTVAPICAGETLNALPTTSNNGITGAWTPTLDNTKTTVYTFTPTTGQCAATTTLTITVNPVITPTFDEIAPICAGETLSALPTISKNGIAGTWTPALDNTKTTDYTFTPAAEQCVTTKTLTITVIVKPTTPTISVNGKVFVSDSPTGNQWYNSNGAIAGATSQSYQATSDGNYYVVTTLDGCSSAPSNSIQLTMTGLMSLNKDEVTKIYPNPVSDELNIETPKNENQQSIEISTELGQVVLKKIFVQKTSISMSHLAAGLYVIKIDNGKTVEFKKIIKQ